MRTALPTLALVVALGLSGCSWNPFEKKAVDEAPVSEEEIGSAYNDSTVRFLVPEGFAFSDETGKRLENADGSSLRVHLPPPRTIPQAACDEEAKRLVGELGAAAKTEPGTPAVLGQEKSVAVNVVTTEQVVHLHCVSHDHKVAVVEIATPAAVAGSAQQVIEQVGQSFAWV